MAWNATRTSRNTLHVQNDQTLEHFEAADEEEANATIAAINDYKEEQKRQQEAAAAATAELNMPVGAPTVRSN